MNGRPSLSIFTIEIDRKPIFAIQSRKHSDAEAILADENIRHQLGLLRSDGKPLCDDFSIFRVRLARADERAGPVLQKRPFAFDWERRVSSHVGRAR